MASSEPSCGPPGRLLTLSAELSEAETVQTAVARATELVETAFEQPVTSVCTYDPATDTVSTLDSSVPSSTRVEGAPGQIPESLIGRAGERRGDLSADETPEAAVDTDPREPFQAEVLVPVGRDRVLCVGVTETERLDETGIATIEGIAANLQTALSRIDNRQSGVVGCDVARALFDQSDDATFVSDTDGRLVALNRAAVELTGRDRDALLTNGLPDISVETAAEPVREHLERTVTGASDPLTTTLEHAGDVDLTSRRVDVDGTSYICTIARDPPSGVQSQPERSENTMVDDAAALRQLNKLTVGADEFDETIERLLSLGCDHFGLDTGILSRVDGDDYEVDTVVDATGTHESGAVYDLGDTMCDATLAGDLTGSLAFADVADTDYQSHPAAEDVRAYIAAPVVVDGEAYGTVNFSMGRPRSEAFRPEEQEFANLVAQWIGTEIQRRHRFEDLERYETILEAVDDPVYALDAEGRFTFVNEAAEREFGYGTEVVGERPSVGIDSADVERIRDQIETLLVTDERSATAEFELETADGGHKAVENRLAVIGDDEFRGTAGVLRDITARRERRRQLESFQQAVERAADGIAVLDGEEYTYVDQSHVDMYGFEDREQLLGNSWRKLYDDEEIERLEREAFPALESEGYWRGMVTGSRPDGSTFPAELSLTVVEDGRFVCTVRDETERSERERETRAQKEFLESIYEVTTDPERTFEEKVTELLEAGRDLLDLPYGFLARVETSEEGGSGVQTITEALGSHELLQPGKSVPLEQSYCRKTIDQGSLMTLTHAAEEGWADDLAYEIFGLETYIGSEVVAGDDLYGTLCFASKEPRDHSFGDFERSFIRLVGRWVGYEIDRRDTQDELREQRERLELALSGTNTGLAEWDLETDAVAWNETLVDIVGRDVDTIEEFRAATHPDDRDRVQRELETMIETGEPWTGEFRLFDDDGETLWLGTRATAVYNGEEPVRVLATGTDISEKKQAERERQRNERRFESLLDDPEMLVALLDTDGTVLTVNETAGEYVDVAREAVEGEHFAETPWWSHSADLQADLRGWIRRAADGEYVEYGADHPGPDGDTRRVVGTVRPVTAASGSVESLVVSGRDVTERDRQQRELEDRQRKLDLVLSNTDTGVAELSLETGTMRWGEEIGDGTLSSPETVDGFIDAVHPDDREQVQSDLTQMMNTGDALRRTFRMLNETGGYTWIAAQAVPTEGGRSGTEIVAIATDVTALKEQEATLRASEQRYRSLVENIPNGAVLTFDADLEYRLAAGELLPELGLEASDVSGSAAGTVLPDIDGEDELVPRFRAALHGERTDRQIELGDRTLRIQIAPVNASDGQPDETRGLVLAQDVTEGARREQELFEERERFRLLTESVDEYAFFVVDEDGDIQTWNESAADTFGYDAETALGMSTAELHPAADRESGLPDRLLQQARVAGESAHEGRRVRADGSEFYADARYAPLESTDGAFRGFATVVRDMTDRRRERRRTERFVEESDDVVTVVDPDGTVTYASGSANRVLGYDPDDLIGENLFDYLHPDGREHAMKTFFACVEGLDTVEANCRLVAPDGGWINVEGRCRNMLDDDAIDGVLVYLRDVTESKRRSRRFESIFNGTFQFTALLDPDGTVVEVNDAALEFGGVERDAIVGDRFFDAAWWTHSETVRDEVWDAIDRAANGEFVRYETEVRGADGLATIDFSAKPVTDEDNEVSMIVVEGRDITARQRYRQHLDVMQRVMRHNMRNDLTKMRGWTQMMCEEPDAQKRAEQFETVDRVLDKWEAMTAKMKQIRTVLESQQGGAVRKRAESLLEDAVAPVREEDASGTVVTDVPETGSARVPATVLDAVRELVTNAVEASADATVEVELTHAEDGWTGISVRDDGPGLPEIEAEVLETGEETPLTHGQGLGLWMVRMIVTQAGGDVSVESTADGTTVRLQLPTKRTVGGERAGETAE